MITFDEKNKNSILVYLDKKMVGSINKVDGGYQYFPKGRKVGGDILPTINAVKKSLTEE